MALETLNTRITEYWTKRAGDFRETRRKELKDTITTRWKTELRQYLPQKPGAKILDAGTGSGYFAVMLTAEGYQVTGIDLTPAMLGEARKLAGENGMIIDFQAMDAQNLTYPDQYFDAIVTRNLTWTLPDLQKAYCEWFRVLKPDGILINFDAAYGQEVLEQSTDQLPATAYAHDGMTQALLEENNQIARAVPASWKMRPEWDEELLKQAGFNILCCDRTAGERILKEKNGKKAPLFMIAANKMI